MLRRLALVAMLMPAVLAAAELPATSPRPVPRPDWGAPLPLVAVSAPAPDAVRPQPRPADWVVAVAPAVVVLAQPAGPDTPRPLPRPWAVPEAEAGTAAAVTLASAVPMVRPLPRPDDLAPARKGGLLSGLFGRKTPAEPAPSDGYVCGDPDIRGDELAPITSKVRGCGVEEPVRVTSVDGVRLNGAATLDCPTATALKQWINEGLQPAFGAKRVVELRIAGSYVCRPRNNQRGAKISEHGRGKAVDIAAFVFEDGSTLSVAQDYNRPMRKAQKAACGIFGTTLGPGSDGYHEDHIHFDTARQENGPYCR